MQPMAPSGAAGIPAAVLLLVSLAAAPVAAGDRPFAPPGTPAIAWVPDLDTALRVAASGLRPILVVLVSESTLAPPDAVDPHASLFAPYRDLEVVRATERFVCLPACPDRHGDDADDCACLRGAGCAAHRAAVAGLRERYLAGAEPDWPEHWILDTDGRLLSRLRGRVTAPELAAILHRVADRFEASVAGAVASAFAARSESDRAAGFRLALSLLETNPAHAEVRRAAARYLEKIRRDAERQAVWRAVAEAGTVEALSLLVPWLEAKSPEVRAETLAVFGEAPPCPAHLPALAARAGKERVAAVLLALVGALARQATVAAGAYDALNDLAAHRDEAVRVAATLAAAVPENRAIRAELHRRARREANPRARAAAILGLARLGDAGLLPALRQVEREARRGGAIGDAVGLAIRALAGEDGATEALDAAIDRLLAESGSKKPAEVRDRTDRTDRSWRALGR